MASKGPESSIIGSSFLDQLPLKYILTTWLLAVAVALIIRWRQEPDFPTVNSYPGNFRLKQAHAAFLSNARGLISKGTKKFNGPFRIITNLGSRIILPASYTEWVKNCPDLDHQALVYHEYFAGFPGMEGNAVVTDPRKILINVTKTKLNQNSQWILMREHITEALDELWKDEKDWDAVNWTLDAVRFIGRMSSSVFAGPELARNSDWQNLTITVTVNTFMGVRALQLRICRQQLDLARNLIKPILDSRAKNKAAALTENRKPNTYNDTLEWMEEVADGRPYDLAAAQLAFAISAMHTTTELLKQTLVDICSHPELIPAVRNEVEKSVEESGWTTAGLFKMQLLDSVVKESQRLKPGSLANLERKALKDITLPNGKVLRKGTKIAVDSSSMWDPEIYPDPFTYDGYRFLRLRQAGNTTASLVSSSPEHIAFGIGKPICPGRFFTANELKIALASILLSYDVKIVGKRLRVLELGFEMLCDPNVDLQVRRRQN